ncbi:MAG: MGMT family protein [Gammaproteobacteria bacterium]|nr:MAG: MGMT family protein [Gammaproteobacteria bacterium]
MSPRERIRLIVAAIPEGSVATYGDVARFAGLPRRARMVGQVLAALPAGSRLPWHRVLRADGRIATRDDGETTQALRLEAEGILVRAGQVDLRRHRWQP